MSTQKATERFTSAFAMQMKIDALLRESPNAEFTPHFNWFDTDELVKLILGQQKEQFIIFAKTPVYDEFTYGRTGRVYATIIEMLQELLSNAANPAQDATAQAAKLDDLLHELMHYCVKSGFRTGCRLGQTFSLGEFINIVDK